MPGDIVFIDPPNADLTDHKSFQFDVTFQENFAGGSPIVETLEEILKVVDDIVLRFRPRLV
jgi:hypothetical protein